MLVDVILGLQWGDEGKGKIVDVLSPQYKIIARFQGGPNAGHTLEFEGKKYILHTIPSGIFRDGIINVIGNGVIIDPYILEKEIQQIEESGYHVDDRLLISRRSHIILPSHRLLDAVSEASKGASKIGSTLKGISPCYTDKAARNGLRIGDIESPDFESKYKALRDQHLEWVKFKGVDLKDVTIEKMTFQEYEDRWLKSLERLKRLRFVDTEVFLNQALDRGDRVLAEGAQGTMLDVDFGSYPYVTSSNTMAGGVCSGLGISPKRIGKIFGIFKAYCTRVGSGPFPTELLEETGETLRQAGREFGSTTGRPRRCGWLDLPALKYSIAINGVTDLIMTKADVLNGFEKIGLCESYQMQNQNIDYIPYDLSNDDVCPQIRMLDGWQAQLSGTELPMAFMDYVKLIEDRTGISIKIVSTGPDRDNTVILKS